MDLKIVWRNPLPLIRTKRTLQRIRKDQFGAVYAVTAPDLTQEYEVILGEVAWTWMFDFCFQRGQMLKIQREGAVL